MKQCKALLVGLFILMLGGMIVAQSPGITVNDPHSGDIWYKGKTHTIKWTKLGIMDDRVKIRLFNSSATVKILDIKDNTDNNGSYDWLIPATLPVGSYRVRVKTIDNKVYDDSDVFEIKRKIEFGVVKDDLYPKLAGIQILKPSSSSFWKGGTRHDIVWKNMFTKGKKYKIDLYNYNGKQFIQNIYTKDHLYFNPKGGDSSTTSKYSWLVPNIGPKKCRIKISVLGGTATGTSDMFTIQIGTAVKKYKIYAQTNNKYHYKYWKNDKDSFTGDRNPIADPGPGKTRTGWENYYISEGPDWSKRFVYRSHVFFNVSQFQGKGLILSAKLYFNPFVGQNCGIRIYKITKPFSDLFNVQADFLPDLNGITSIVQGWVAYPSSNHGFLFAGTNEKYEKNNSKCVTYCDQIYLEIEFLEKK